MQSNSITACKKAPKPDLEIQFLQHLEQEKGRTRNTIDSYRFDLNKLSAWTISQGKRIDALTRQDLRQWIAKLTRDEQLNPRSVTRAISTVRGFFSFLVLDRRLKRNPAEGLYTPKCDHNLPGFLTTEEIDRLFAVPDTRTIRGVRDRAIMETLYAAGLRVSELANLRQRDIDLKGRRVKVNGKGQKQRMALIGRSSVRWLRRYAFVRGNQDPERMAFASQGIRRILTTEGISHEQPVTRQDILNLVQKYAERAGLQNVSAHTLRHTFATHLLQGGADSRSVQLLLGHSDISTTQIYLHITTDRLRDVYNHHHPRGRDHHGTETDDGHQQKKTKTSFIALGVPESKARTTVRRSA